MSSGLRGKKCLERILTPHRLYDRAAAAMFPVAGAPGTIFILPGLTGRRALSILADDGQPNSAKVNMSPNTAVGAKAGLFTDSGAAVPLAGVRVDAEISNLCARVEITQRFVNRESTPIEAVYVFPLDEAAALCGFSAMIGNTLVVGEVMERSKAFDTYDKALEAGHGAFLLDQERPDVFTASVGNVLPGTEVTLRLVYVTELQLEGSALRFVLPTTVSPRYAPLTDRAGAAGVDAERVNPPVDWQVPYGLSLAVRLALPGGLVHVESPSHHIRVTWHDTQATVTLAHEEVALDRDFVLTAEASGLESPRAWVEQDDDGRHAIALAFRPRLPVATVPAVAPPSTRCARRSGCACDR